MIAPNAPTNTIQDVARVVLGLFMAWAGIGHLTFRRQEFHAQVPTWLPLDPDLVVVLSGVVELVLAAAMVLGPRWKVWAGLALATFFVVIFPGNIHQYVHHLDAFGLNTDRARLIRLFFQPVLVAWAVWCSGAWTELRRKGVFAR